MEVEGEAEWQIESREILCAKPPSASLRMTVCDVQSQAGFMALLRLRDRSAL
jgi:hypothetical protein